MSDIAIRVDNLSKAYRISHLVQGQRSRYKTLQEEIVGLPRRAWQTLRGAREEQEIVWALRDVSFEVREGDVVGIIGRNGAGKSTLLKILSRITEPTGGQADLYGRVGSLLEVGTGFHPELTGRENVFLSGAVLGMRRSEIQRRFDEIVDFAGVEQFIDTPVKRFSSGMYMRLAFSVAAHLEPEILIVDEVLAVGDAEFQKKSLGKIGDVAKSGRTVLFVSHNMAAVESICTRALMLAEGRIVESGLVGETIQKYLSHAGAGQRHVKRATHALEWRGLLNRDSLENVHIEDDLELKLGFASRSSAIIGMQVDWALINSRDEYIVHARSQYVAEPMHVAPNRQFVVTSRVKSPRLAPGSYKLEVYVTADSGLLLWVEEYEACRVISRSYFGVVDYYEGLLGAVVPEFSLELHGSREGTNQSHSGTDTVS